MKPINYLSFVVVSALCLSPLARADFIYKTRITLPPDSSSVAAKVQSNLDMFRRSGMSEDMINLNRVSLEKTFQKAALGSVTEGITTVCFDGKTTYVSTPSPNLSDPEHPGQSVSFFDGTNTYRPVGLNPNGAVLPKNAVGGLSWAPDQLLLGRLEPQGKLVAYGTEGANHYKATEFGSSGNSTYLMKTIYSPSEKIIAVDVTPSFDLHGFPLTHYDVESYDSSGHPSDIKITYFDRATRKATRIDEFWLTGTKSVPPRTVATIFKSGDLVIDERLGYAPNQQVSYLWTGSLPSLSDLKSRHIGR